MPGKGGGVGGEGLLQAGCSRTKSGEMGMEFSILTTAFGAVLLFMK